MNFKAIAIYIGHILRLEGILMLPAAAVAIRYGEGAELKVFLLTAAVTFIIGQIMSKIKTQRKGIYARDGFVTVALCWIAISAFGALPFWISGAIPGYVNCFFETGNVSNCNFTISHLFYVFNPFFNDFRKFV